MWLHNKPVDIDSGLVNGQRFDSRLLCANSKPVLNLSKAGFFNLFVPGLGRRRDQRIVRLRAEVPLVSHREERASSLCLAGYYIINAMLKKPNNPIIYNKFYVQGIF